MNLDDFERRLSEQPFRPIPEAWRQELVQAVNRPPLADAPGPLRSPLRLWLREWLWPSPAAWGALAACWVAVLLLNQAAQPSAAQVAEARANARLALAYQALVRDYGMSEPDRNARPTAPAERPHRRPGQSQTHPSSPRSHEDTNTLPMEEVA